MGLEYLDARMLWDARLRGRSFDRTLMVGRLSLYLHPAERATLTREYLARAPKAQRDPLEHYAFGCPSDDFLRSFLETSSLTVVDYSAYEGASFIHDLNHPVSSEHANRYDAVIDGGSLEHVFNFPVALASLMQVLKVGGTIFLKAPANNFCGHGFYQFSPELMFRVFTPANGFDPPRIVMVEARYPSTERTPYSNAYIVTDPKEAGARVGLVSRRPVMMLVEAQKVADVAPFAVAPLQSDYVVRWSSQGEESRQPGRVRRLSRRLRALLPEPVVERWRGYLELHAYSFRNRRFYRSFTAPAAGRRLRVIRLSDWNSEQGRKN